jgi:hypothetical protein
MTSGRFFFSTVLIVGDALPLLAFVLVLVSVPVTVLSEEDGGVTGFLADCANAFADVPIINNATNIILI